MGEKWRLINALLGGTAAMRAAGTAYLPQEPREQPDAYANRLSRSFLFNGFKEAVAKLAAKPFSKPITVQGSALHEQIAPIAANADREGSDLTSFAKPFFENGISHGQSHILVDYPSAPAPNMKEQAERDVRPYFVHVTADNLLGVRTEKVNGVREITEARIFEKRTDPGSDYGEVETEIVRVYRRNDWQIFRREAGKTGWIADAPRTHTFGGVPLVTLPICPIGFVEAEPPLQQLAEMNLAHWQSYSDQRNILRFARLGLLFGSGFTEEEIMKGITLGPASLVWSTNSGAQLRFVEHTGSAIKIGRDDVLDIQLAMEMLAMQPLLSGTGNPTATGKAIDEAKAHSAMQAWIKALENALEVAYRYAARWIRAELPEDFGVDVFSDFGVSMRAAEDIQALISLYTAGALSLQTVLREVKRRGLLSDQVSVDDEIDAIAQEGPRFTLPPDPDPMKRPEQESARVA